MILCGFGNLERIMIHEADDLDSQHYIDLVMSKDESTFAVTCCCYDEWFYEFLYSKTDYERIKFNIVDSIFACDDMDELISVLDDIFQDGFEDIIIESSECLECCGDCDKCNSEYLN